MTGKGLQMNDEISPRGFGDPDAFGYLGQMDMMSEADQLEYAEWADSLKNTEPIF